MVASVLLVLDRRAGQLGAGSGGRPHIAGASPAGQARKGHRQRRGVHEPGQRCGGLGARVVRVTALPKLHQRSDGQNCQPVGGDLASKRRIDRWRSNRLCTTRTFACERTPLVGSGGDHRCRCPATRLGSGAERCVWLPRARQRSPSSNSNRSLIAALVDMQASLASMTSPSPSVRSCAGFGSAHRSRHRDVSARSQWRGDDHRQNAGRTHAPRPSHHAGASAAACRPNVRDRPARSAKCW